MRKTKIVCTIGPATDDDKILREMMLAGMNVARFNFSHGDYDIHKNRFEQVMSILVPTETSAGRPLNVIEAFSAVHGMSSVVRASDHCKN